MEATETKEKKKRKFLRWFFLIACGAGVAYALSKRQKHVPCVPAGGPEERIIVRDSERLSGLGEIMKALLSQLLQDPAKMDILNTLSLVVSIEPKEAPDTAVTMTFSDGYAVIEPGVVGQPDIHIICETEVLMKMSQMGSGVEALKFLYSREGKELLKKFRTGEVKIKGLVSHPVGMLKFSRLLSVPSVGK